MKENEILQGIKNLLNNENTYSHALLMLLNEYDEEYVKEILKNDYFIKKQDYHYMYKEDALLNDYSIKDKKNVVLELREHYKKNLPVDLLSWSRVNFPHPKMTHYKAYWNQIITIRDRITPLLSKGDNTKFIRKKCNVISTHISKSVTLPVCLINSNYDFDVVIRDNFISCVVSIISKEDINIKMFDLVTNRKINSCYCEGFPEQYVFDCYDNNKKEFTISLFTEYQIYAFFYNIVNSKYN